MDEVEGELPDTEDHETKEEVKLPYPEPQKQQVPDFDLDQYEDPDPEDDDYDDEENELEDQEKSSKGTAKKAKSKDKGETETPESSGPDREWQPCSPTEIMIHVNVMYGENIEDGILLLNRVCSKTDMVWVKIIKTGQKKDKIVQVHASDVEIKALSV